MKELKCSAKESQNQTVVNPHKRRHILPNLNIYMLVVSLVAITSELGGQAIAQDAKTAYQLGYRQGYVDGKNSGGGGTNDIKPGDTMVVLQPNKGGGSSYQEVENKFMMVYNGASWTGFSQVRDGQADTQFFKDYNIESLKMGKNTGIVWSLEPNESVSTQMERLVGATGKLPEDWLKLLESQSPELNSPGLKKYEAVTPFFQE